MKSLIRIIIKKIKFFLQLRYLHIMELTFPSKIKNARDIPILINSYNRMETLIKLIDSLEKRNYKNIYIIDNQSSYPPLLAYYNTCKYKVIRLEKNMGFKALWKSHLRDMFCNDYYIYTDSDVVLCAYCPDDVIEHLFHLLKKHKYAAKIGLSLRIDNLPDCYQFKQQVIARESRAYKNLKEDNLYRTPTDTTFAIYRPRVGLCRSQYAEAYRTAPPYQMEHLPWYSDSSNLSEDELYYINSCTQPTEWSSKQQESK